MAKMNSDGGTMDFSLFHYEKLKGRYQIKQRYYAPYKLVLLLTDVLLICAAYGLAAWINGYHFNLDDRMAQSVHLFVFTVITGAYFLSYNLYSYHLIYSKKRHFKNLAVALSWSLATIGLIFGIYLWPQVFSKGLFVPGLFFLALVLLLVSRFFYAQLLNLLKVLGIGFLATGLFSLMNRETVPEIIVNPRAIPLGFLYAVLLVVLGRYVLVHLVFNIGMRRQFRRQVLIIGSNQDAEDISNHVIEYNAPFWISGILGPPAGPDLNARIPKKRLGTLAHLPQVAAEKMIDEVIITDDRMEKQQLVNVVDFCTAVGITVWFPPKLMPIIDVKLYIDNFCGLKMIRLQSRKQNWLFDKLKYAVDALLTLPVFVLLLPVFTAIAVAIKLDSNGPVFYKAKVVGKNAGLFHMYKFRSMRVDAGHDMHKDYVTRLIRGEIGNGGAKDEPLKITDDPRVTRVGKVLRKLSLDELPQLINVLKGEMSLVGPRPCLPYEYDVYQDWYKKRTLVRPGITGLWQVAGRSAVAFEDMILLDLYYIFNHNIAMDFNILYETVFVVLGRKGAY